MKIFEGETQFSTINHDHDILVSLTATNHYDSVCIGVHGAEENIKTLYRYSVHGCISPNYASLRPSQN